MVDKAFSVLKTALKLQLKTDVGRVNYSGMVLVGLLMIVMLPNEVLNTILVLLDHEPSGKENDPLTVVLIYMAGWFLCAGGLALVAARADKAQIARPQPSQTERPSALPERRQDRPSKRPKGKKKKR